MPECDLLLLLHPGRRFQLVLHQGSYFPLDVKVCFKGYEGAKQQLHKEELGFEVLNNGFLPCKNLERLQAICHQLTQVP